MRIVRTALIAGAATLALAGAAFAARDDGKLMLVALPDGTVEHIRYQDDVARRILLVEDDAPAAMLETALAPLSIFAEMQRVSAAMDARAEAMMRQASALQAQAASPGAPGQGITLTNAAGEPVGVMHYSYVSSTTGSDGCTRTVSYSSDAGAGQQPRMIQTSSGTCGAAPARPVAPTAVSAPAARPSATSSAKITPVRAVTAAAELQPPFPPSRT